MATHAGTSIQKSRSSRPTEESTEKSEKDFLASVMISVSSSLEGMSEERREQAVTEAERAVAHLQ
jgi:hypothetical protein